MKNFLLLILFASLCSVQAAQPRVNTVEVVTSNNGVLTNGVVNGVINVKNSAYGATGNGALGVDDTAAIQAAMDAAGAHQAVYFPKPTSYYKITSKLKFRSGQRLFGDSGQQISSGQTEIRMVGGTDPVFAPNDTTIDTVNVVFDSLKMTGATGSTSVLNLYRTSFGIIKNCCITGGQIGVLLDANVSNQCYFNKFDSCTVNYLSVAGYQFQGGANANMIVGGVVKGCPISIKSLSLSAGNTVIGTSFQGVASPDDTLVHVYADSLFGRVVGGFMEGTSISKTADVGSTTTVFQIPTLGATVNQYIGYKVRIRAGTGLGGGGVVTANTATTITIGTPVSIAPDATSTISITRTFGVKATSIGAVDLLSVQPSNCATNYYTGGQIYISSTATAGGSATLTDSSLSMTVNQYATLYRIRILSGTGAGQHRIISSNTATQFTVTQNWATTPDATSVYQVEEAGPYQYNRWSDGSQADSTFPGLKNHLGMFNTEQFPSSIVMPIDFGMESRFGAEDVSYNWGKLTKTTGTHLFNFYNGDTNTAKVNMYTGRFIGGGIQSLSNLASITFPASFKMQFLRGGGVVDSFYLGTNDVNGTEIRNTPGGDLDFREGDNSGYKELTFKSHTAPHATVTWGTTTGLNFTQSQIQTLSIGGNTTFTTGGKADGRRITVYITGDGSDRTPTWPSWKWVGGVAPTTIVANRVYRLDLYCTDANDTGIYAVWADLATISDSAYSSSWNGDLGAASKNSIYDKIETLVAAAAGTNAVLFNETIIQNPNFKDTAITNSPQIRFTVSDTTNVIAQFNALGAQTDMTLSSDDLSAPTSTIVRVIPESGTSDDLATIAAPATNGISVVYLFKRSGDSLTIKHSTGNLLCPGNEDAILGAFEDGTYAVAVWDTVLGKWRVNVPNTQLIPVTTQGSGSSVITSSSVSRDGGLTQRTVRGSGLVTLDSGAITGITIGLNAQINSANLTGINLLDSPTVKINSSSTTNFQFDVISSGGSLITKTIASDGITLPSAPTNIVFLTSESSTSDNLSYISPPSSGTRNLILRPTTGHTITIKHGVTNIVCMNGADIALSGSGGIAYLYYDTSITNWVALSDLNSGGGGGSAPVGTMVNSGTPTAFYPTIYSDTTGTNMAPAIYGYPYDGNPSIPANGTNWNQKGFVYMDGSNIGYGDGAAINTAIIASDTITWPAQRRVTLQSESGTSDNLSTIDYTGVSSSRLGAYLYIQPKSGHTITIKHGTGNLFTSTAADVVLDRTYKYVIVTYDPAASSPNLMVFVPNFATIPTSASPSTTSFGQLMGDNNAWAASHGTLQFFDGTANVYAIATQASDTPSAGQVPKFNSDGTITWELDNGTADNWLSSGSTNSTLSGNAAVYSLTITNGLTVQGGSSQGTIMLYDSAGSPGGKGVRLSAPATQSTNINFILPDRPSIGGSGGQGIPILTVAAVTNVTMSITNTLAGLETALGSVNIIDQTEIDTSAELNTIITDNTGSGALVFGTGPTLTDAIASSSFQIPNGAAPTTDAFGEIAGDNNAWAVNRGAAQFFDGTANTYLIGALVSDVPSNGQVPKFNSATGTITWENDDGSSASISDTAFGASWDAVTTIAPSKNAVYDVLHLHDKDDDGKVDTLDIASSIVKTDSLGGVTNAVAETDYVTPTGSGTLSNKTIDAANNVIKSKGYIKLAQPRNIDGTGCTYPNTNDFTASTFMLPLFDGTTATNSNWARFSFRVPMDWDSSVDPVANISFRLAADDTSAPTINLGVKSTANSANGDPTVSNWINFPQGSDTLGVNGDVESSNGLSLTGWGALLTAGQWCTIQINRDGSGDTSNQGRYLLELEIEYGKTQ